MDAYADEVALRVVHERRPPAGLQVRFEDLQPGIIELAPHLQATIPKLPQNSTYA